MTAEPRPEILLIEDDRDLGIALSGYLELRGFTVRVARDGAAGIATCAHRAPDLVLLDIMLPKRDGFEVAQAIREASDVPIVFLTARGLKLDRLKGYALGADDYVVKPVDEELLIARVKAVLRRSRAPMDGRSSEPVRLGATEFTPATGRLRFDGGTRQLTDREAALLALLIERRGELLSRRDALHHLWGRADFFSRRSMDVYIHRLRHHLRRDSAVRIVTVRGRGFVLEVD